MRFLILLVGVFFLSTNSVVAQETDNSCQDFYKLLNSHSEDSSKCKSAKLNAKNALGKNCEGLKPVASSDGKVISSPWNSAYDKFEKSCLNEDEEESCGSVEKEFNEYSASTTSACRALIGKFPGEEGSEISQCAVRVHECLLGEDESDEDKEKRCAWVGLTRIEDLSEKEDALDKSERELMKQMTQDQIDMAKESEKKLKQVQEMQSDLNEISTELSQIESQMHQVSLETEGKNASEAGRLRNTLTDLRSQLSSLKSSNIMRIETQYLNAIRNATNKCEVDAKITYQNKKEQLVANTKKGLSLAQLDSFTKNSKIQSITYLKNLCIESGSEYLTALSTATDQKNNALIQNKTEIARTEELIRNAMQSYNEAVQLLEKEKNIKLDRLYKNQVSFQMKAKELQNQIQQQSQPAQSDLFGKVQQQQSSLREFEALNTARSKIKSMGSFGVEKDDLKYVKDLLAADKSTYESHRLSYVNACCRGSKAKNSKCSDAQNDDWTKSYNRYKKGALQ